MSPYMAYLLGLLTFLLIMLPFWIMSTFSYIVSEAYYGIFCTQAISHIQS